MREHCNRTPLAPPPPDPCRYAGAMGKVLDRDDAPDFSTVDAVLAHLRARGSRVTSSRRILLEVLFATDGHLTAEELAAAVQARAPDVHLSTIYRNLDELEHLGVVSHSHLGHGPSSYSLASHAHAHFMCGDCGVMIEAPPEMFRSLARAARSDLGFTIDPKHFAILGRCADCESAGA